MRQIAYVLMSWDVILGAARSREAATTTLPPDAKVSHVVLLHESQMAQVYFTSSSLEPVYEGQVIPEYPVVVRALVPA